MNAERSLHVIAMLEAKPGSEDELRELALTLVEPTRAEAGCLRYELIEDPSHPSRLTFVETWESESHLQAHLEAPHLIAARARYDQLLSGGLQLRRGVQIA
jgi:quinol monooxygenase YgiN